MEIWQLIILGLIIIVNFVIMLGLLGIIIGSFYGVPFVPTTDKIVKKMLEIADIHKGDTVFDLGCGDGRLVFGAEDQGAFAIGIEVSPPVYLIAILRKHIMRKKSKIVLGNFFNYPDIVKADIIFIFLFPDIVEKFYKEIFPQLKSGIKIISHAFKIKDLKPKAQLLRHDTGHAPVYLFVKD